MSALGYKQRNDCKIFYLSAKLIASDSDTDKAFISMHQSKNSSQQKEKTILVKIGLSWM